MENIISSIFKFVKAMYVHVYTVYIYVVNICLCRQSSNPIIRVCVCVRACVCVD